MTTAKRHYALTLILLVASMLALYPATSMEQPQHGSKRISIDADGRAFVIGKEKCKGTGSSASLILSGLMQTEDDEESKFEDLSGVLTVGSTEYAIQKAEGEVNNKGRMEINGKTMSGDRKLELVLHGSMNENNVAFNCPESKLSSMYFLSLAGEITFEADTTSTSTTNSETATVTVTDNRTFTETVTETDRRRNQLDNNRYRDGDTDRNEFNSNSHRNSNHDRREYDTDRHNDCCKLYFDSTSVLATTAFHLSPFFLLGQSKHQIGRSSESGNVAD